VIEREQKEFEATLRKTRLVKLPEELRSRLLAAAPPKKARSAPPWPALVALGWLECALGDPCRSRSDDRRGRLSGAVLRPQSWLRPVQKLNPACFVASPLKADDVKNRSRVGFFI